MLKFLEKVFGTNEDGTPKAITFEEFEKAVTDGKLKVADLSSGAYVSKEKYESKETELTGIRKQLDDANAQIQSYKDMDIDGIKAKVNEWEKKYADDTAELNNRLSAQERAHQTERFFDQYKFTSVPARKGIMDEFAAKDFKLENGKFLGADDFMKGLMESEDYKGAFVTEPTGNGGNDSDAQQNNGADVQQNDNPPFFSAGTQSQTNEPKGSVFGFGFTGVRKHE